MIEFSCDECGEKNFKMVNDNITINPDDELDECDMYLVCLNCYRVYHPKLFEFVTSNGEVLNLNKI